MKQARIPILMYHMVRNLKGRADSRYCCTPRQFRVQMFYLKWAGFHVIDLNNLVDGLIANRELPRKTIAITFDDGFKDNFENALPVLKKYGFPATLFVVSGLIGKTNTWMLEKKMPERELISYEEIQAMAKNKIEIGSHTVSHADMTSIGPEELSEEVRKSKEDIESETGIPVRFFAYPYGRLNESARRAVMDAGYKAACSTRSGFNNNEVDPFILRRMEVYGDDSIWTFALKITWGTNDASLPLILRYYLSRIIERFRTAGSQWN